MTAATKTVEPVAIFTRYGVTDDGLIAALWAARLHTGERFDTKDIAEATNLPESAIANRLAFLRDSGAL